MFLHLGCKQKVWYHPSHHLDIIRLIILKQELVAPLGPSRSGLGICHPRRISVNPLSTTLTASTTTYYQQQWLPVLLILLLISQVPQQCKCFVEALFSLSAHEQIIRFDCILPLINKSFHFPPIVHYWVSRATGNWWKQLSRRTFRTFQRGNFKCGRISVSPGKHFGVISIVSIKCFLWLKTTYSKDTG